MESKFYSFNAKSINGNEISMNDFKSKVVMIVNTASKCGFTPQYAALEELHQKYKDKGLMILGFPCNQFANQEPKDEEAIKEYCSVNYGVSFPMFSKVDVNGANAHPLFKYLKKERKGIFGGIITWNFTKFLIDKNGKVVKRFSPTYKPEKIEKYIIELL